MLTIKIENCVQRTHSENTGKLLNRLRNYETVYNTLEYHTLQRA